MNSSITTHPNANYPPYGYNDSNFNRIRHPSNIYPMNGGMPGTPFGQYNPITTNNSSFLNNNTATGSYNQAYLADQQAMIEKINYVNKGNLIHNNIGDTTLDEFIEEYRIHIDSLDRDIKEYPDPFKFTVKFNTDGKKRIHDTLFDAAPGPLINKQFRNVKYVKLENIIFPRYNKIIEKDGEYVCDTESSLLDDRFISLVIKELQHQKVLSTLESSTRRDSKGNSVKAEVPYALIIPDKVNKKYFTGLPYYGSSVYKNSDHNNLDQLTIDIRDSCNVPVRFEGLYDYEDLCDKKECNEEVPETDIRHPKNKKHQLHLTFIVGVVEGQQNKNTKFEK